MKAPKSSLNDQEPNPFNDSSRVWHPGAVVLLVSLAIPMLTIPVILIIRTHMAMASPDITVAILSPAIGFLLLCVGLGVRLSLRISASRMRVGLRLGSLRLGSHEFPCSDIVEALPTVPDQSKFAPLTWLPRASTLFCTKQWITKGAGVDLILRDKTRVTLASKRRDELLRVIEKETSR